MTEHAEAVSSRQFVVQIVKDEGDEVVWSSEPTDERRANKIADGAGINLNWETHRIQVVAI